MAHTLGNRLLHQFLDPVVRSPEIARTLVDFQIDDDVQARVSELAGKANEGTLTKEERDEYHGFIEDLISILQLKARNLLERSKF